MHVHRSVVNIVCFVLLAFLVIYVYNTICFLGKCCATVLIWHHILHHQTFCSFPKSHWSQSNLDYIRDVHWANINASALSSLLFGLLTPKVRYDRSVVNVACFVVLTSVVLLSKVWFYFVL